MKRTLLALAAVSVVSSGAAFAGMSAVQRGTIDSATVVPVQYYERGPVQYYERGPVQYYERGEARSASIDEREARIHEWIQRGLNEGRIRPWEARRLQQELADIQARERALTADGRLSGREFAELNRDLDRLADNVRERMHFER
ncbi:MAG: hypothetical protein E6H66_24025 [Betaproteobacteria bacterium]|nr:MAG: hypothetical protein E6H66_24025 [Betaproteobacteria bacterium]